jgi:hypothetical protein
MSIIIPNMKIGQVTDAHKPTPEEQQPSPANRIATINVGDMPKEVAGDLLSRIHRSQLQRSPIPETSPTLPPSELQLPADKVTTINVGDIKPNSILIVHVDVPPELKGAVAPSIAKLLSPFTKILREKCVTVMIMSPHESIELIPEEVMSNAGWEKKAKSLIINPFSK